MSPDMSIDGMVADLQRLVQQRIEITAAINNLQSALKASAREIALIVERVEKTTV